MPDDRGILEAIGGIIQKWNSRNKKNKKEIKTAIGLESKLASPSAPDLTKRERIMLKNRLAASSLEAQIGGTQTVGGPFSLLGKNRPR